MQRSLLPDQSGAVLSACKRYRYKLWRRWVDEPRGFGVVNFLMLNPSTADELANDPTVERCERRARAWGFDGLVVTNLFAMRATNPSALYVAAGAGDDPVGPENNQAISDVAAESGMVLCAWGAHGNLCSRSTYVKRLLIGAGLQGKLHVLNLTVNNQPGHPLYVSYRVKPRLWKHVLCA